MNRVVWIVFGALLLGGFALFFFAAPEPDEGLYALSFVDFEGSEVSLGDFSGPLVVNLWAVWCPFCKEELKEFAKLQEEFAGRITVVAIDRAEPLEKAKGYTDAMGITDKMTFLLDPADSLYRAIGGFSMPETVFLDKEGVMQDHKRGPMDLEEMRRRVQKIL